MLTVILYDWCSVSGMAFILQILSRPVLDELTTMLGLAPATYAISQCPQGCYVVAVHVVLGPTASVPELRFEASGQTPAAAEQNAAIIALHALAAEYQVELKGINYPQVFMLRKEVAKLEEMVDEYEALSCELLEALHATDSELLFTERLSHKLYRRIRQLRDMVAMLQQGGGGGSGNGSN
jgi:hypothetical protein